MHSDISFETLDEFPFRRLARLLEGVEPPGGRPTLDFSIGEPKHAPPALLAETVAANADLWNRYPPINGTPEFRRAAADWLSARYRLAPDWIDPDRHVLPLAGTKEGLFLLPSGALEPGTKRAALMPDPVYSVYVGAGVLAGLEPVPLPATRATGFLPDLTALSSDLLARTALMTICTPANPQGVIAGADYLEAAITLARRHDFLLVLDECYSEIYDDQPPVGGLQVAHEMGQGLDHLVVMHSLSKRSNAAGLRSGFIAGDDAVIRRFARFRAYGGAVQPMPLMAAATRLWQDEDHVIANRDAYRRKMAIAQRVIGNRFGFFKPEGGFFLWLEVEDSVSATRRLWQEAGLRVLPGAYLTSGPDETGEVGRHYIRLALVHDDQAVEDALNRLIEVLA